MSLIARKIYAFKMSSFPKADRNKEENQGERNMEIPYNMALIQKNNHIVKAISATFSKCEQSSSHVLLAWKKFHNSPPKSQKNTLTKTKNPLKPPINHSSST